MIHHWKDGYEMECDDCGETIQASGSFDDLIDDAHKSGWKSIPDGGKYWLHRCPECVEKLEK